MKTVKVSEATSPQLNYLVADIEGKLRDMELCDDGSLWFYSANAEASAAYSPSTDWSQGGPIIEREGIFLDPAHAYPNWSAIFAGNEHYGPTPLIAAMRCYVASKLGNEVEVPEELA